MSTPAWKPLPSARRITTRVSGSRPAARSASASWNQPATGSAFTGGLSMVTITTCSRVSERIMRGSILPGMVEPACEPVERDAARRARCPRPPLPGDVDADVAIVGAGYTGLWTAYALQAADPTLRVVGLRARDRRVRRVGPQRWLVLGALRREPRRDRVARTVATPSSRCSARCSRRSTRSSASSRTRASTATGRAAAPSQVATLPAHRARLTAELADHRSCGFGDDDYRELERRRSARAASAANRTSARCSRRTARRSIPQSSCTASRRAVERAGVHDLRAHAAVEIEPGSVRTARGDDPGRRVVRATEAFTADAARPEARDRARLLADDRDRAVARRVLGGRRPRTNARRSPTPAA